MNPIEQVKAFVAANPSARVWVEEALFRGEPGENNETWGVIKGAHFVIGIESTNPVGQPTRQLLGPFPASAVPTDAMADMAQLIGLAVIMQQQTIDGQAARIVALEAQVAALTPNP